MPGLATARAPPFTAVRQCDLADMKILIACHDLVATGGLMRFERFGRIAVEQGHEVVFTRFNPIPPTHSNGFRHITVDEAEMEHWDATMIPGAGFPHATIAGLSRLRTPAFGLRVQHVLNDTSRRDAFIGVHRAFEPDVVVLNNRHWTATDLACFSPSQIHVVEGAVDVCHFRQNRSLTAERPNAPFVIGGQTRKTPALLLDAVRRLPHDVHLHLFGEARSLHTMGRDLIEAGRLRLTGALRDEELPRFYSGLHCVVHVELSAGWANMVAEAMAAEVAVICTTAGTLPLATHNETAIVLPKPDVDLIVDRVSALRDDPGLYQRLITNAYRNITTVLSWRDYTDEMLRILARL